MWSKLFSLTLLGMAAQVMGDCVGDTNFSPKTDANDNTGSCPLAPACQDGGGASVYCPDPTDSDACVTECITLCGGDDELVQFKKSNGKCYAQETIDCDNFNVNDSYIAYEEDAECAAAGGEGGDGGDGGGAQSPEDYQNAGSCSC